MAERKYDLALVKTVTDKKIRPQEWYDDFKTNVNTSPLPPVPLL